MRVLKVSRQWLVQWLGASSLQALCASISSSTLHFSSWEDIDLMCRTFFGSPAAEHELQAAVPYREVTLPEKLRFGFYTSGNCFTSLNLILYLNLSSDAVVKASPACKRAVLETVEALRKQGHECVEFSSPISKLSALLQHSDLTTYG